MSVIPHLPPPHVAALELFLYTDDIEILSAPNRKELLLGQITQLLIISYSIFVLVV